MEKQFAPFTNRNRARHQQTGFVSVFAIFLVPLMMSLMMALAWAGLQTEAELKSLNICRHELLKLQKNQGQHYQQLFALNPVIEAFITLRNALEAGIAIAAAAQNYPLVALFTKMHEQVMAALTQMGRAQDVLKSIIQNKGVYDYLTSVKNLRDHLKRSEKNQRALYQSIQEIIPSMPDFTPKVKKKYSYEPTSPLLTVNQFTEKQQKILTWAKYDSYSGLLRKILGPIKFNKKSCSASLKQEGENTWKAKLIKAKYS